MSQLRSIPRDIEYHARSHVSPRMEHASHKSPNKKTARYSFVTPRSLQQVPGQKLYSACVNVCVCVYMRVRFTVCIMCACRTHPHAATTAATKNDIRCSVLSTGASSIQSLSLHRRCREHCYLLMCLYTLFRFGQTRSDHSTDRPKGGHFGGTLAN